MDTLLVGVGAPVRPPDAANMDAFAHGAPARNPRVTAPTAGVATHPNGTVAALQDAPVPLGHASQASGLDAVAVERGVCA